jgi:hypothetical protein
LLVREMGFHTIEVPGLRGRGEQNQAFDVGGAGAGLWPATLLDGT